MQLWMDDLSEGSRETTLISLTFHVCMVCTWQFVVSVISVDSASCRDGNFICLWSSMEWRHKFVLIGIRASFPWNGTGRRKSGGTTDWDNVAVHFER